MFSFKFKKYISRRAISDIKKSRDILLNNLDAVDLEKHRDPILKFESVDRVLSDWIDTIETSGGILNENLIKEKALRIAKELEIENFKASQGWLEKFKTRHGLKSRKSSGESYNADINSADNFLKLLKPKIEEYGPKNIYNEDETGLFYKLIPSRSICKTAKNGYKILKDRVSVLFCSNMLGTDKRKPVVIGRHLKPRCFKEFSPSNLVDYEASSKAWMNAAIFNKWLLNFDLAMEKESRKILLVVDNCSSHKITVELKCIEIMFLPPNTTSIIQPLDQGILKAFKTRFTSKKLNIILNKMEIGEDVFKAFKEITIKDAIIYLKLAWDEISPEKIHNCYKHAKWINEEIQEIGINVENYDEFLENAKFVDPVEQEEFIKMNYNEKDILLEEYFLSLLTNNNMVLEETVVKNTEFEDEDEEDKIKVSTVECYLALNKLERFFGDVDVFDEKIILALDLLNKKVGKLRLRNISLDDWLGKK